MPAIPSALLRCFVSQILVLMCLNSPVWALDKVKLPLPDSAQGSDGQYARTVIREALQRTRTEYGDFQLTDTPPTFPRKRLLAEMIRGEDVNLTYANTQPEWEEKLLTVRVPLDMGLQGLRIALIREDAQPRLNRVHSPEDLKTLTLGVGTGWSTEKIFAANGYKLAPGDHFESLLRMLIGKRSDLYPRGLEEVFPEFELHRQKYPGLAVDQHLLISMPMPVYVFVSPRFPQLARRIETGMESMVRDGSLRRLMLKHHSDMLMRADLCARQVIHVPNPLLKDILVSTLKCNDYKDAL